MLYFFFFQAEDGIRDLTVTGVQTCALPIYCAGNIDCAPSLSAWSGSQWTSMINPSAPAATAARAIGATMSRRPAPWLGRSEERRVGKSVDLGGRRIIKKKKREQRDRSLM